jgi:glycosyltransferase involved in cell wall biosynthesis
MSKVRHRVNRLLSPLGTAWVAVAHGQKEYLLREKGIPAARLRVIPNGIDPSPFRAAHGRDAVRAAWGFPPGARVAGILAALRPEKDHKTFLLAARFVADELPEARFVLVGDGPRREDLAREIAVLDLAERAVLAGPRHDVPAVLSAFDVSVLCSTDVETFPLAFLESMATGLPLIGTRVGGLPEMIAEGRNGMLVRPRDPRGLADAMLALLRDPDLARRYGEESRRRVEEEFSLERMVRAWEDLFTDLLR